MNDQIIDREFLSELRFEPLTKDNWNKFVKLFGANGAGANCWCMHFRQKKSDHEEGKADDKNKDSIKELVWNDQPTGILGFYDDIPIAWCAFSPREDFIRLRTSRVHKPIDNKKVWSVPCTFVAKEFRKHGVSIELLKGVVKYGKEIGIKIIEAYPTIPTQEKLPDGFAWIGLYKSFEKAGFEIVDRTSKHRPMVRYYIE
ncbi:GNAT family N-acetyltransferase [uncultured Aquimarina sp.]|uniref:GNAT family N-acetyltransferase n=1 Tax=uncultured Aquimarina sp. TaxID=575652 RepID=UPI0026157430|nr:GNAT family N-acetyltransferase [uncultured Aquimarina sp.]